MESALRKETEMDEGMEKICFRCAGLSPLGPAADRGGKDLMAFVRSSIKTC